MRKRIIITGQDVEEYHHKKLADSVNVDWETVRESKTIREIESIQENNRTSIHERSDIEILVEEPLVKACQIFYDKNIMTIYTTANKNNARVGGSAAISIEYDSLSDENKEIAEANGRLYDNYGRKEVQFTFPITSETLVSEVERASVKLANLFKDQEMTWGIKLNFDDMKKAFCYDGNDPDEMVGRINKEFGRNYYHDKGSGMIYLSEEQFHKMNPTVK